MCFSDNCTIFFFKQKTAYEMRISDWSSDVCSSDLRAHVLTGGVDDADLDLLHRLVVLGPAAHEDLAVGELGALDRVEQGLVEHRRQIGRASCRERVRQYV